MKVCESYVRMYLISRRRRRSQSLPALVSARYRGWLCLLDPTKRLLQTFHTIHIALSTFHTQALALVFLSLIFVSIGSHMNSRITDILWRPWQVSLQLLICYAAFAAEPSPVLWRASTFDPVLSFHSASKFIPSLIATHFSCSHAHGSASSPHHQLVIILIFSILTAMQRSRKSVRDCKVFDQECLLKWHIWPAGEGASSCATLSVLIDRLMGNDRDLWRRIQSSRCRNESDRRA